MEPWGLFAALAILVAAPGALLLAERRTRARRYMKSAAGLGLKPNEGGGLSGRLDGFRVELGPLTGGPSADLTVDLGDSSRENVAVGLHIRAVTVAESLTTAAADDVRTGDEAFDNAVEVRGGAKRVLAVLDAPTRELIDAGLAARLQISDGRLHRRVDCENLANGVRSAVELARRLALSPDEVPGRLAHNALHDPWAEVRLRILDVLLEDYPRRAETRATLKALLRDADERVRLRAALALGKDGHATLTALVGSRGDDAHVVLRAFEALAAGLPDKDQWPVLDAALDHHSPWVRQRAVAQVVHLGGPKAASRLVKRLADPNVDIAADAGRALTTLGDSSCEGPLIEALSAEDLNVRQAAAEALGHVGTAAAVAPLQEAMGGVGMAVIAPDVRRAARHAIEHIQARLPGAKAGQLSLARSVDASGQVSLTTDDTRGRATLTRQRSGAAKPKSRASRRKTAAH